MLGFLFALLIAYISKTAELDINKNLLSLCEVKITTHFYTASENTEQVHAEDSKKHKSVSK